MLIWSGSFVDSICRFVIIESEQEKGAELMRLAYVRVSTEEQNEKRQIESLKTHDIERWYIEKNQWQRYTPPETPGNAGLCQRGGCNLYS